MSEEMNEVFEQDKKGILGDAPKKGKKKVLTPEQKKKRTKKALIITGAILGALVIFFGSCAIANVVGVNALIKQAENMSAVEYAEGTQLVPVKDSDGYWTFTTDDDFTVMQFTDVHIGGGCFSSQTDPWAMNAVATMIRQQKPDLVVVTGDIAYPVVFQAGTLNNLSATKIFANMMESLGVYWTFSFGNHDTEAYSYYSREDICDYYESQNFKYCLFNRGFHGGDKGYGNNIIKVKNSAGIVTQAIVTLDSHSYIDGDILGLAWKYDNLHDSQVNWYKTEIQKLVSANMAIDPTATELKNLAFLHIPTMEYRDAWKEYVEAGNKDTDNVKFDFGVMGESDGNKNGVKTWGIYCGMEPCSFFEAGLESGLQGIFCGHDHYNNFSVFYNGGEGDKYIRLTYGMSTDYLAYPGIFKEHSQRGCTVITVKPDGSFDVEAKNYYTDFENVSHEKD